MTSALIPPVRDFADGRLRNYFEDLKSYKVVSEETALRGLVPTGRTSRSSRSSAGPLSRRPASRWRWPPRLRPCGLADELPGTWHHLRRGAYRVVPLDARRARSVTYQQSKVLEAEGWVVVRR